MKWTRSDRIGLTVLGVWAVSLYVVIVLKLGQYWGWW